MARSARTSRGEEAFEAYYRAAFGERWPLLRRALVNPELRKTVRVNSFADPRDRRVYEEQLSPVGVEGCHAFPEGKNVLTRDSAGLRLGYVMDVASVLCGRALPLSGTREVLDLCAAPGGKSLLLAESLPPGASLTCNDRSPARRERLRATLDDYLPAGVRERVKVTGFDGRRFGLRRRSGFDAVLLDAPCSSEAHVLRDPRALSVWSPQRVRQLCRDQYALLTSALLSLRVGGALLYSTCALLRDENDGVVARLLERGRHPAVVERLDLPGAERTEFGQQFLPDRSFSGPLFVCLLTKTGESTGGASGEEEGAL